MQLEKISPRTGWVVSNATLGIVTYCGYVQNIVQVQYVFFAFVCVMILVYWKTLTTPELLRNHSSKNREAVVPRWLEWLVDTVIFAMLIFGSAYITAAIYVLSCLILEAMYIESDKRCPKAAE